MPTSKVLGKLVLSKEGGILKSGGVLQNDEKTADHLHALISTYLRQQNNDPSTSTFRSTSPSSSERLSLHYSDHSYVCTVGHRQIHIVKVERQLEHNPVLQEE